ncbi:MAG: DUF2953 domain-containing protein [Clostridia bacterium]|nr:DUF2953 domain-containing protein [Clostridia bacterium]
MIVLKIIGWVLLGILALIVLALCIKVKITAEYSDDNTNAQLQWLFLKIPLYPKKKKAKKPEEEPEEKSEEEEEEAPAEEKPKGKKESMLHMLYRTHGVDGLLELTRKLCSYLGTFLGGLFKSLVVEELYVDVRCAKQDAAETALYYGEVCSALFPMLGALAAKCKVKKYDINVYPDFLAKFSNAQFFAVFRLYPIYVVGITLALLGRLIFKLLLGMLFKIFLHNKDKSAGKQNINKKEKEDDSNEGSDSGRNPVNNDRESASAG